MSAPPITQLGPPLPPGWTEHIGPTGHIYYHNTQTKESTYVRPLPSFFDAIPAQPVPVKKRKEKPLVKTQIPGTDWIRVTTTEGNVFYSHKIKKESVWLVPDEIKEAVTALEESEAAKVGHETAKASQEIAEKEAEKEVERVKAEVQELVKRKAEAVVLGDEVVAVTKKAKLETEEEVNEEKETNDEEEEEEWQREAAMQLAKEAEEQKIRSEAEETKMKQAEETLEKASGELNMPGRVDLSLEEGKALFKTLLLEKDINPLHPWDVSLPLFISDPRYVLLPSVSVRREVFDEYCRERARQLREQNVKKQKEATAPKEDFERLLQAEVKSTRISWTDFRRAWKKDRRFWGWGRDDREREKRFREYVKDLGDKKRAAAHKAEADFFALLKEFGLKQPDSSWKDVKRTICDDPRYDAVGSSSLREELFNTFLRAHVSSTPAPVPSGTEKSKAANDAHSPQEDEQESARRRKEKAVREREEKIKAERSRVEAEIGRSRLGLSKDEGERDFRTMLTDAIRDPQMTWEAAFPQLQIDPRFTHSPLPRGQQVQLFHAHVGQLRSRQIQNLDSLFETHAPSLATTISSLPIESLLTSSPAMKLGLDMERLEREFARWQRERTSQARKEFDQMLSENSFVEFWGRLGKIGGEGVDGGVKADDQAEDEGEGGGGKVDMKALAKSIDVAEMVKVLQNDRRFIMFDHVPDQRERWIRDYISQLAAPKLSVHIPEHSIS